MPISDPKHPDHSGQKWDMNSPAHLLNTSFPKSACRCWAIRTWKQGRSWVIRPFLMPFQAPSWACVPIPNRTPVWAQTHHATSRYENWGIDQQTQENSPSTTGHLTNIGSWTCVASKTVLDKQVFVVSSLHCCPKINPNLSLQSAKCKP